MAFQIVRCMPVYHPVYDGICGATYRLEPNLYETYGLAQKLASIREEEGTENCGDDSFYVIEAGKSVRSRYSPRSEALPAIPSMSLDDEIPF